MIGPLLLTVGMMTQCYSGNCSSGCYSQSYSASQQAAPMAASCYSSSYGEGGGYSSPQTASLYAGSCYSSNAYSGGYSVPYTVPIYQTYTPPVQFVAPYAGGYYPPTYGVPLYGKSWARRGRFRATYRYRGGGCW
jgi:hypothetical protein